jgi:hypothetical protein
MLGLKGRSTIEVPGLLWIGGEVAPLFKSSSVQASSASTDQELMTRRHGR